MYTVAVPKFQLEIKNVVSLFSRKIQNISIHNPFSINKVNMLVFLRWRQFQWFPKVAGWSMSRAEARPRRRRREYGTQMSYYWYTDVRGEALNIFFCGEFYASTVSHIKCGKKNQILSGKHCYMFKMVAKFKEYVT